MSWPEDDQRKALEWQAYDDSLCPGCAQQTDETTAFRDYPGQGFEAEAVVCHGCAAIESERAAWDKSEADGAAHLHGVKWRVREVV